MWCEVTTQVKTKKHLEFQISTLVDAIIIISTQTSITAYRGGGEGTLALANPTHATIVTASITQPNMSYFRSLLFCDFGPCSDTQLEILYIKNQTTIILYQQVIFHIQKLA